MITRMFSSGTPYGVSVQENTAVGTSVGAVSAMDADSTTNGVVSFSISSGDTNSLFAIGASTGVLSVAAAIDLEVIKTLQYTLVVVAVNQGTPALSSTSVTVVTVNDVNDNTPAFVQSGS